MLKLKIYFLDGRVEDGTTDDYEEYLKHIKEYGDDRTRHCFQFEAPSLGSVKHRYLYMERNSDLFQWVDENWQLTDNILKIEIIEEKPIFKDNLPENWQ